LGKLKGKIWNLSLGEQGQNVKRFKRSLKRIKGCLKRPENNLKKSRNLRKQKGNRVLTNLTLSSRKRKNNSRLSRA
jgi:hypothetical protein